MNQKTPGEEKRGDKGRTLLCLSSPPNATHVRGLGNNESRSQWDCRHYRVRAGSVCERWLCWLLLFTRWLCPCDGVTFHRLPFGQDLIWYDVLKDVALGRFVTCEKRTRTGVHHARMDLCVYDLWSLAELICTLGMPWTHKHTHTERERTISMSTHRVDRVLDLKSMWLIDSERPVNHKFSL